MASRHPGKLLFYKTAVHQVGEGRWHLFHSLCLSLAMPQGSACKCYWLTKCIHGPHSLGPPLIWLYPRNHLNSLYLVKSSPGHPERVKSVRGFVLLCFCFCFYVWRVHFCSLQKSLFPWGMDREEILTLRGRWREVHTWDGNISRYFIERVLEQRGENVYIVSILSYRRKVRSKQEKGILEDLTSSTEQIPSTLQKAE